MAKSATAFICSACSISQPKWSGQCPNCLEWNTLSETVPQSKTKTGNASKPVSITTIKQTPLSRLATGLKELDLVLGAGLVESSTILIGGEPGIGKSTLALQVAQNSALKGKRVLYVSAEESLSQLSIRAARTGQNSEELWVHHEQDATTILATIDQYKPDILIIDSIQVIYHPDISSIPGSINQVRHCANELSNRCKSLNITCLLIGHITKDGALAGPKVLEHIVDVILYFEGERHNPLRILRSLKNRYSSTQEIGLLEMNEKGLGDIPLSSTLFLNATTLNQPGSIISAIAEGSRILLVELQALVVNSGYGMAKRTVLGVDTNRANVIIATIEKILDIRLSSKDIILNIIGGLSVKEPSLDLAVLLSILSSDHNIAFPNGLGAVGELGLTGEVRPVKQIEKRIKEFEKMGLKECLVPEANNIDPKSYEIKVIPVQSIREIASRFIKQ